MCWGPGDVAPPFEWEARVSVNGQGSFNEDASFFDLTEYIPFTFGEPFPVHAELMIDIGKVGQLSSGAVYASHRIDIDSVMTCPLPQQCTAEDLQPFTGAWIRETPESHTAFSTVIGLCLLLLGALLNGPGRAREPRASE